MKISFGVINYNRLFYLKSCAESLMESVKDYDGEVEFICIDDNSKEKGTKEYLQILKDRGWTVINQEDVRTSEKKDIGVVKDVIDEFSSALNIFLETATGEYIAPLQGDMQFVRKGWLDDYVNLFKSRDDVFAVALDAQRRVRLEGSHFTKHTKHGNNIFAVNIGKIISGAGDCFYNRMDVKSMGGWHVGTDINAEDLFTHTAKETFPQKHIYVPWIPPSVVIFTDPRGTNGRVRGNKRYGLYWEALKDNLYYKWVDANEKKINKSRPLSIEDLVAANGEWELPIDENGNWKKNPINWPINEADVPCEVIF
tara:strand:+ start:76 stop:1008 length:933 start_codon:yes stop_codon:yes gene_type:complete